MVLVPVLLVLLVVLVKVLVVLATILVSLLSMLGCRAPARALCTSVARLGGQKAKRRKQRQRAENPHLPVRSVDATATSAALAHFDDFYGGVYKAKWPSMRLALLSQAKHCALVNNFGDMEATVEMLEELGCLDIGAEFLKAQEKQRPFQPKRAVLSEGLCEKEVEEQEEEAARRQERSTTLEVEAAAGRLVEPEERVMGGGASPALYDFVPPTTLKGMEEFVEEADYYSYYKQLDSREVRCVVEPELAWPAALRALALPRGVVERLPRPRPGALGTLGYYCMDAASLLPVLALDLKPGQAVLDMCAGPGGKTLAILQTLCPASLVCNDVDRDRVKRVINVLDQFVGREDGAGGIGGVRATVRLSRQDGATMVDYEAYDRVLVDAPCYTDRHAVNHDDSNVFVKQQIKDRLKMPERQAELLKAGLTLLKPGGCLVYSTCTLSPVQNDGVVHMALRSLWEETTLDFEVCDLSEAVKPFRFLCKLHGRQEGLKYGQLVVPFLPNNFGPMYFAKIRRLPK